MSEVPLFTSRVPPKAGWSPKVLVQRVDVSRPAPHPGGNPGASLESISHICYFREVAFEWELTKETIFLPLRCLQGGYLKWILVLIET